MRILVFGGAGFIGSHVVELLHSGNNDIFIFDDLSTGKLENIQHLISVQNNSRVHFELLDIQRRDHVFDAFCNFRPEIAINLAAQAAISTSISDPEYDAKVNIKGMLHVIAAAKECHCQQIIFSSTSAVYKEKKWGKLRERDHLGPQSPYGISKLAAERYLRTLFPDSIVLRFGNVFGPRQVPIRENQVIPRMIRHFEYGDNFQIFGDGEQTRDYVFVDDAAYAVAQAMLSQSGTYNIASGKRMSVNDVAESLADIYGVRGYEWEHRKEPEPRHDICMDSSLAYTHLGWKPTTPFMDGLKQTVEWWKKRERTIPRMIPRVVMDVA